MRPQLKVYRGEEPILAKPPVALPLGELARLLENVASVDQHWMRRFGGDVMQVPAEVFEALARCDSMRPTAC